MANRALDSQLARDALAAALVLIGVVATACGAFLVSPTVGFLVVGGECLALGVALGWGEREGGDEGEEAEGARERKALRLVVEEAAPEPPFEPSPDTAARSRPQAPIGPMFVSAASYLGTPRRPEPGGSGDRPEDGR